MPRTGGLAEYFQQAGTEGSFFFPVDSSFGQRTTPCEVPDAGTLNSAAAGAEFGLFLRDSPYQGGVYFT